MMNGRDTMAMPMMQEGGMSGPPALPPEVESLLSRLPKNLAAQVMAALGDGGAPDVGLEAAAASRLGMKAPPRMKPSEPDADEAGGPPDGDRDDPRKKGRGHA